MFLPLKSKKEKQVFMISRCVYVVSLSRNLRIGVISRYILVQQWFTFYIMISHLSRIGTHTHRVWWSTCNGGNWISSRFCVRIPQYQIERSRFNKNQNSSDILKPIFHLSHSCKNWSGLICYYIFHSWLFFQKSIFKTYHVDK